MFGRIVPMAKSSVLSETDERESGEILLHWLLYVSCEFGNENLNKKILYQPT